MTIKLCGSKMLGVYLFKQIVKKSLGTSEKREKTQKKEVTNRVLDEHLQWSKNSSHLKWHWAIIRKDLAFLEKESWSYRQLTEFWFYMKRITVVFFVFVRDIWWCQNLRYVSIDADNSFLCSFMHPSGFKHNIPHWLYNTVTREKHSLICPSRASFGNIYRPWGSRGEWAKSPPAEACGLMGGAYITEQLWPTIEVQIGARCTGGSAWSAQEACSSWTLGFWKAGQSFFSLYP